MVNLIGPDGRVIGAEAQAFKGKPTSRAWLVTSIGLSSGVLAVPHQPVVFAPLSQEMLIYGILTHRDKMGLSFQAFPEPLKQPKGAIIKAVP